MKPTNVIEGLLDARGDNPNTLYLWQSIEDQFGGPSGFAKSAKVCYDACKAGSAAQVGMMTRFFDLYKQAATEAPKSNPIGDLEQEELEAALAAMLSGNGSG